MTVRDRKLHGNMSYLKILARLFKTWFFPQPPHDAGQPEPKAEPHQPAAAASSAPDGEPFVHDEESAVPAPTGVAPLNPVAPPEGAEERESRSSTRSTPPAAE